MQQQYGKGSRLRRSGETDEWVLEEQLGSGESGAVYSAVRADGAKKSAIKVVTSFQNHHEDLEELAEKERRAGRIEAVLEKVKNMPHIVRYEDCFRLPFDDEKPEKGFYLIIRMERLTPLRERLKTTPMNAKEAAKLGCDICSALEACHESGIIHRDIKPANILVTETGDYKLGDFGIAYIPTEGRTMSAFAGTYDYIAPEVFLVEKEKFGPTIDTYSLGLVLYRLLNKERLSSEEFNGNRFKGAPLPPLAGVDQPLCDIRPVRKPLRLSFLMAFQKR